MYFVCALLLHMERVRGNSQASDLAARLRTQRERADLTQAELADVLGVSFQALGAWERGDVYPRAKHRRLVKAWLEQQEQAA